MNDKQTKLMFEELFKVKSSAWFSRNGLPMRDRDNKHNVRRYYATWVLNKFIPLHPELVEPVFEEATQTGALEFITDLHNTYPLSKEFIRNQCYRFIGCGDTFGPFNHKEICDLMFSWLDKDDIDYLCEEARPEKMWTNAQRTKIRKYLVRKGIITFGKVGNKTWKRHYSLAHLDTEEVMEYAELFQDIEFSDYDVEEICKMQGKSGERKFLAFLTWPGFLAGLKKYRKWLIYKPKWSYTIYEFMSNVPALKEEYYADFFDALKEEADIKAAKDKKLMDKMNKVKEYTIAEFGKKGIELTTLQGNYSDERPGRDRNQFAHWHDDVQYMIYVMGPQEFPTQKAIDEDVHKLVELKKRHHNKIKLLYNHIKEVMGGDIWVMSGGGAQLQAFYGDKDGYIGTLYLDMEYGKEKVDTSFSFTINRQELDKVLGGYKQFGIKIVTYKEVWGNTKYYKPELENTQE